MRLFGILLFLCVALTSKCQSSFDPINNFKKDLQAATVLERHQEFELASRYYPSLISTGKLSSVQLFQIGINYLRIARCTEAIDIFKTLVNKEYSKLPISRFYLANAYFRNGEFDLAKIEYQTFSDNFIFQSDSFKEQVKYQIINCDTLLRLSQKSGQKVVQPLSMISTINSPSGDRLNHFFYTDKTVQWRDEEKSDIRTKELVKYKDISSETETELSTLINNEASLQSDVDISEDGNILVFTRTITSGNQPYSAIYYARRSDSVWEKPIMFASPVNLKNYSSKHPSIVKINLDYYLYYSSNKPNGKGGFDIYFAELNADFNIVKDSLLPDGVNTAFDEISPFYNKQKAAFFFSSNRLMNNFGGFDIFSYKEQSSPPIQNIGMFYNSGGDDYFYRTIDDRGFLVSNRQSVNQHPVQQIVYEFKAEKNYMNISIISNFNSLTNYELSIDENNIRIYTSDTSVNHKIELEQNKMYRIKVRKENYLTVDTTIFVGYLKEGENVNLALRMEPVITVEGKVYFVDYDTSAPKVKQCVVELIDLNNQEERVIYSTTINKQNRKFSFQLPIDKKVKLRVKAPEYNTYDTTFVLQDFKTPGGFINNVQLHQIQKNNIYFLDSLFILDDEIRTYNDFEQTIKPRAIAIYRNEGIRAELTIQCITTNIGMTDFQIPSAILDVIRKYFLIDIPINKQIIKQKTTARNQEWYKLYLTYK
jgi:hypothetical protein